MATPTPEPNNAAWHIRFTWKPKAADQEPEYSYATRDTETAAIDAAATAIGRSEDDPKHPLLAAHIKSGDAAWRLVE